MELIGEYGLFLAKITTVLVASVILFAMLANLMRSGRQSDDSVGQIEVRNLNTGYEQTALKLKQAMLSRKQFKAERKASKARLKNAADEQQTRLFVLEFDGDLQASAVASLREEITAVLKVAEANDELLLRLESAGGLVHAYGLAAAQLMRVRAAGLRLTVSVDQVAASGGYMMACVADRILVAPFAVLGSIGVIAQLPNFHRLLKRHDIDFEQFMAGEHKRTVTLFGENTDPGREKLQQEIEEAHGLFKEFIARHRPQVDLKRLATGEHWYGTRALELGLADQLSTSDDYLLEASRTRRVFLVRCAKARPWLARLMAQFGESALFRRLNR